MVSPGLEQTVRRLPRLNAHSRLAENRHALVADPVARLVLQALRLWLNDEPAASDAIATAPCAPADQARPGPDNRDAGEHFWVGNDLRCGVYRVLRSFEQSLIQALVIRLRRHPANVSPSGDRLKALLVPTFPGRWSRCQPGRDAGSFP